MHLCFTFLIFSNADLLCEMLPKMLSTFHPIIEKILSNCTANRKWSVSSQDGIQKGTALYTQHPPRVGCY